MKYIVCVCCLAFALGVLAQDKVIEKSAKKTPSWITQAADDYLVVGVTSSSLASAQNKVLTEITEQIIRSVATNISVSQQNTMSEVNTNGSIESSDAFVHHSKLNSANLPFLKGISLSNVEEIYWEKVQNKNTKAVSYNYWVKYPYSKAEQRKLIREFEQLDASKVSELNALKKRLNNIQSYDEIKQSITELNTLSEYFFDEVRLSQVKGLIEQYNQLYSALSLTGNFTDKGQYLCQVLLNGYPIRVAVSPKVTSNCASQIGVQPSDGAYIVSYLTEDCLPTEENFLNIDFRLENKRLQQKAYLNEVSAAETFSVVPQGKIILTADSVAGRTIYNINIRMTVNNRGGTPFGLKALEFYVPELSTPIVFDDINAIYKTKGVVQINATAEGEFTAKEVKSSAFSFVDGSITFVNPTTGAIERKTIKLPYATNWQ